MIFLQFAGCASISKNKTNVISKQYKDPAILVPKVYDYGLCVQINDELSRKVDLFFPADSAMLATKRHSAILTDRAKKEARKTIFKGALFGGLGGMLYCDLFWLLAPDNVPNGRFFAIASPLVFGIGALTMAPILLYNKSKTSISTGIQKEYYQLLTDYNNKIEQTNNLKDTLSIIHND